MTVIFRVTILGSDGEVRSLFFCTVFFFFFSVAACFCSCIDSVILIYLKKDATYAAVSAVIYLEIHLYGAVLDC